MKKKASWELLKNPIHFCSLGAGSGLIPGMPGTYGSLLALFLFLPLTHLPFSVIPYYQRSTFFNWLPFL